MSPASGVATASLATTSVIRAEPVIALSVNGASLNSSVISSPPLMSGVTMSQQTPPGWLTSRKPFASSTPLGVADEVAVRGAR